MGMINWVVMQLKETKSSSSCQTGRRVFGKSLSRRHDDIARGDTAYQFKTEKLVDTHKNHMSTHSQRRWWLKMKGRGIKGEDKRIKHVWTPILLLCQPARRLAVISALGWGGTPGDKGIQIARAEGKHFTLHSFWEDTSQCPCPIVSLYAFTFEAQRVVTFGWRHLTDPFSQSRCVMMTFYQWVTWQTCDHPTSVLAEIL